MEGLARPREIGSGRPILPAFSPMAAAPQTPLLFLNFESSVLDQGVQGSGVPRRAVSECGLVPGQIVIEINESKAADVDALSPQIKRMRAGSG